MTGGTPGGPDRRANRTDGTRERSAGVKLRTNGDVMFGGPGEEGLPHLNGTPARQERPRGSSWTRKTVLFATTGITAFVGGMIFNDLLMIVLAIVLMSILIFAFATTQARVEVTRHTGEARAFEDEEVRVTLRIRNRGASLGMVQVYDRLPSSMMVSEGSNKGTFGLRKGEEVRLDYTVSCPLRGYYNLGPVVVRRSDIFGIFSEDVTIQERTHLTVYPHMAALRDVPLRSRYRKVHPGSITTTSLGQGTDFHSIRDYVSTDPFKKINWKVTARQRKLMVNQYETEDIFDVLIFVDARDITRVGTALQNPLEYSVKAASALTRTLMGRTNRVALVTYGRRVRTIHPGSGEVHLNTILSTLTGTYAKGDLPFKDAVDMAAPYITPNSPVILLSPLDGDDTIKEVTGYLAATHHHFTIISPSAVDFERNIEGGFTPRYLMVKLERENLLNELRGRGAHVVDWTPELTLDNVVREVV